MINGDIFFEGIGAYSLKFCFRGFVVMGYFLALVSRFYAVFGLDCFVLVLCCYLAFN